MQSKLYEYRRRAGLSQAQLAERVSVHPTTIGKYESGQAVPSLEVALRIAKVLGQKRACRVDNLFVLAEGAAE